MISGPTDINLCASHVVLAKPYDLLANHLYELRADPVFRVWFVSRYL